MMIDRRDSPPTLRVSIAELVRRKVLAGRLSGEADRASLEAAARRAPAGSLLVLDLIGVEVISSSYFAVALWPLWSIQDLEASPILANIPEDGVDDILLVLKDQNAAVWRSSTEPHGELVAEVPELFGALDAPLQTTLRLVVAKGEVTAADLMEADRTIGMTAWSNRLAALSQLRLLSKRKDGRRLIYAATWKERIDG